jgi:hypothetical protein
MKSFLVIAAVFACFTSPHGVLGIWVMKSQVVAVEHPLACSEGAHAQIVTVSCTVCVKETPQQVLKTVEQLKD